MMSRPRLGPRTGLISALAAIAVWLSAALGGTRAPAPNDALRLQPVAAEASSAQLPAVRQVVAELSAPIRAAYRSPGISLAIDRSDVLLLDAGPRTRAQSMVSARRDIPPRRLAFPYDATAPPTVL